MRPYLPTSSKRMLRTSMSSILPFRPSSTICSTNSPPLNSSISWRIRARSRLGSSIRRAVCSNCKVLNSNRYPRSSPSRRSAAVWCWKAQKNGVWVSSDRNWWVFSSRWEASIAISATAQGRRSLWRGVNSRPSMSSSRHSGTSTNRREGWMLWRDWRGRSAGRCTSSACWLKTTSSKPFRRQSGENGKRTQIAEPGASIRRTSKASTNRYPPSTLSPHWIPAIYQSDSSPKPARRNISPSPATTSQITPKNPKK